MRNTFFVILALFIVGFDESYAQIVDLQAEYEAFKKQTLQEYYYCAGGIL